MSNPFLVDANFSQQPLAIQATYDSFSTSTGSILTDGGLGVKLSAHIGEQLTVNSVNITPSLGDIIFERERVLTANTLSPATVGEFLFYNDVTQSFKAIVSVHVEHPSNNALDKNAICVLHGSLNPSGWVLNSSFTGDVTGIKFSITDDMIGPRPAGSILYTNSNSIGTTTTIRFRAHTISPTGALNDADGYVSAPSVVTANTIDYTVNASSNWDSPLPESLQDGLDTLANRLTNIKFEKEYHVSKSGNNTTGNGSYERPYLTVQAAVTASESLADGDSVIIYVHPGIYSENVTIVKPKTSLVGMTNTFSNACQINGNITINPRVVLDSVYNTIFTIENFLLTSNSGTSVVGVIGSNTCYLHMSFCKVYSSSSQKLLYFNNTSSTTPRTHLYKIQFINNATGTGTCIECNTGCKVVGSVNNCEIYGNSTSSSIISRGASTMNFSNCILDGPSPYLFEALDTTIFSFSRCMLTSGVTNASGINMSSTSIGGVYHCVFNIPSSSSYPANLTPPATTTGYAVKGTSGANFTYGDVSFVPLANIGGTYYWTTNKISSSITIVPSQTSFSAQA